MSARILITHMERSFSIQALMDATGILRTMNRVDSTTSACSIASICAAPVVVEMFQMELMELMAMRRMTTRT